VRRLFVAGLACAFAFCAPAQADVLDDPVTLSCGGSPAFSPAAFHNPTGAERADTPQAQALRDYLRQAQEYTDLPPTGWRILVESPDTIVFQADPRDSYNTLTFVFFDGAWRARGQGCSAMRVVPGLAVSPVHLRRDRPSPRPSARSIALTYYLNGNGCQIDTFRRFAVRETRHTVTVLALLDPGPAPPPNVACSMAIMLGSARVKLDRPLGRRAIRDASGFPIKTIGRAQRR
jgi:hypothetical protein